jgi:hypothetical protein
MFMSDYIIYQVKKSTLQNFKFLIDRDHLCLIYRHNLKNSYEAWHMEPLKKYLLNLNQLLEDWVHGKKNKWHAYWLNSIVLSFPQYIPSPHDYNNSDPWNQCLMIRLICFPGHLDEVSIWMVLYTCVLDNLG